MLSAKSLLLAVAATLAIAQVADAGSHHVKVHVHHVKQAKTCQSGFTPVSVEGVEGVFCAKDKICVADIADGNCPTESAPGMPYGAFCGKVKTGVYGCKPSPKPTNGGGSKICGGDESPMSVEGIEGIFCVKGQACVADIQSGACPGPQEGLPDGAYCGKVKTGVFGCKPGKGPARHKKSHKKHMKAGKCGDGFTEVSVEGVEGVFCAKDKICVADIKDGNCPTESAPGMPYGAYCDKVKTGVYGCKPKPKPDNGKTCGQGESPMSVEGVEGIFCVSGQACVANIQNGTCPGPQEGLPTGSYCGTVKTGVFGCKPGKAGSRKSHNKAGKCGNGFSEVSVEGVPGVYCAKDQICVANIQGSCPDFAECGRVKTGVLGCKKKTH